jgi:hypothetical protein
MKVTVTITVTYDGTFDEDIEVMRTEGCSNEYIRDYIEGTVCDDILKDGKWVTTIEEDEK